MFYRIFLIGCFLQEPIETQNLGKALKESLNKC